MATAERTSLNKRFNLMIKGTNLVSFIAILCKTLQKHEMTKGESEPSNEFSMVCRSSIALEIASMKL